MLNPAELACIMSGQDPPDLLAAIRRSRPAWMAKAACREADTALFFPERGRPVEPARAVCDGCPVSDPCLAWALEHGELGVWAGTTRQQRDRRQAGAA